MEKINNTNPFTEYKKQLNEQEQKRQGFDEYFSALSKEFYPYLKTLFDKKTAHDYRFVIDMLGYYLSRHTQIEKLEEVKKSMIDKVFIKWFNINSTYYTIDKKLNKKILGLFFNFLKSKKSIVNEEALRFLK